MIHWHHNTARNACLAARNPNERMSTDPRRITCPRCRAAAEAHRKATDETLKNAPAVKRRPPTPTPAGSP